MNKSENKKLFDMSSINYFLRMMWKRKKIFYFFFVLYILFIIVQPLVNVFAPRIIIDEMSGAYNLSKIICTVVVMIAVNVIIGTSIVFLDTHLSKIYYEDFNRLLEANLGKKCMELVYSATEDKKTLDYIHEAKLGIQNAYSGGMTGFFKAFSLFWGNFGIIMIMIALVVGYSPLLLVLVVVNVGINYFMSNRINEIQLSHFEKLSFIDRGYYFLLHTLSDIRYGKDIRMFNAQGMMIDRVDNFNSEQAEVRHRQANESQKFVNGTKINLALTSAITYLYLAFLAVMGSISVGEFVMLATSVSTLVGSMNVVLKQVIDLQKFTKYASKYIAFMEKNSYEEKGYADCVLGDNLVIEFVNVSFKYPGQSNYALKNINVKICKGERWSIVGLNGAGKTTFIKLLCRLYECTEGVITLNGKNILEYKYENYMNLLAAVFQDYQLLNFSIKENITVGDSVRVSDSEIMPLIDQVGLRNKVDSLPMGLDTPVFRYYDMRGFEPSGGEQQKIAIARALYKDAPILILDEPTAALDPMAELEVYERFNEMTANKTALFISHRLSSCKFCDSILVFNNGEIVERGRHEELINIPNGLYGRMYRVQEQYYV